jgi:hypothetical protein
MSEEGIKSAVIGKNIIAGMTRFQMSCHRLTVLQGERIVKVST